MDIEREEDIFTTLAQLNSLPISNLPPIQMNARTKNTM